MRVKNPDQIKRWRKQRQYSQRDLAFLVRKSQTAIYAVENGRMRTISEDFALALAARLDVPWDELFDVHESEAVPVVTSGASSGPQRLSA